MNYEIVELKEMFVGGIAVRTSNEEMKAVEDIGRVWQRFMKEKVHDLIGDSEDCRAVGLYTEYEKDHTKPYTFMAGCVLKTDRELEDPIVVKKIEAGKFAKFSVKGDVKEAVMKAWMEIWSLELDRTFKSDFEVYHPEGTTENAVIDLYISIR